MMCAIDDGGRTGQDDPEALLDRVTDERALRLEIEIGDTLNTITLRQTDESGQYQSKWQREDSTQADQTTCEQVEAIELIGKLLRADGHLAAEHRPVAEIWNKSCDRIDTIEDEER